MSITSASTIPFPTPGVRFAKVFPRFDELPAAAQRLWIFLWEKTGFGTRPVRITDPEIADACGRGIRWVQKALAQLVNLEEDGVPMPVVDRFRQYGPRDLAGRVIQIIVRFAGPAEPQPSAKATTRPAARAAANAGTPAATRATPTPTPDDQPPPSPEQAREAAARLRAEMARTMAQTDDGRPEDPALGPPADDPSRGPPPLPCRRYWTAPRRPPSRSGPSTNSPPLAARPRPGPPACPTGRPGRLPDPDRTTRPAAAVSETTSAGQPRRR